jgi:hypothetical protein
MYEIWLMMNIGWEIALTIWPLLAGVAIAWAALLAVAWRSGPLPWQPALPTSLGVAAATAALAFLALPALTQSSLAEMGYWVDWATLASLAVGVGGVALAFAWPLSALRRRPGSELRSIPGVKDFGERA